MICKGMSVAKERENKQLRGSRLTVFFVSARRAGKFAGEWRVGYSTAITKRDEALTTIEESAKQGEEANTETKIS